MLETSRVIIRPFEDGEADALYSLVYADEEVRKPWSNYSGTREAFRERFKSDSLFNGSECLCYYALVRKQDHSLIGLMGFQSHTGKDRSWLILPEGMRTVGSDPDCLDVELTYAMGKAYWGQGYATEAGAALVDYGFQSLGIHRIINAISPDNLPSRRLMERLGFHFLDNGRPQDVIGILEASGANLDPPSTK